MAAESTSLPLRGSPREAESGSRAIAQWWSIAGIAAVVSLFTTNGLLTAAGIIVLPLLWQLTWRRGEPPILFMACLIHWIQSFATVFQADVQGQTLQELGWEEDLQTAIWLSLCGLITLAAGMRVALKGLPNVFSEEARYEIAEAQPQQIFKLYLGAYVISTILAPVAFVVPQITQIIVSVINVKWAFIFLLLYVALQRKTAYDLLAIAITLELLTGLVSYFSSFSRILFVLLIVIPTASLRFTTKARIGMVAVTVAIFLFSVVWSAVKPEYRSFVNRGTGDQEVYVSSAEALGKLTELISDLDADGLARGTEALAKRVGYVDFFAATIGYVPAMVPHQNGGLWLGAILHVLQPRLLFPEKAELQDSEVTREYTGLYVAGAEEGTSVSIGYFGESYIDFGPFGMVIPIFLVGCFWGGIYRLFMRTGQYRVLGVSIATSILVVGAFNVGLSSVKLIGGNLMAVIVMLILRRYLLEPLMRWCGLRSAARRRTA